MKPARIALRPDSRRPETLDDVVVNDVSTFRAEMMDKDSLWMACYFPDSDERVNFWVRAKGGRLVFTVTEQPGESEAFQYERPRVACPYDGAVGEMFLANLVALRPSKRTRQAVAKACTCGQHRVDPDEANR